MVNKVDDINNLKEHAINRGGECLSIDFINTRAKYAWKCNNGHTWEATWGNVKRGRWCSICSSGKSERFVNNLFQQLFNVKFNKIKADWLFFPITNNKLELDGYNEELKIAFEYQGEYHYVENNLHNSFKNRKLEHIQSRDEFKKIKCKENGVTLIQIPYFKKQNELEMKEDVIECILFQGGSKLLPLQTMTEYKELKIFDNSSNLQKMKDFAISKGGLCLADYYLSVETKYKWQCDKNHTWEARWKPVKEGHWCPYCVGLTRSSIDVIKDFAISKGGKCLSTEYKNNRHNYQWECHKGHQWTATSKSLIVNNTWCPHCANNIRGTIKDLQDFAETKGGKCLSNEYKNCKTKYVWKCSEGHTWNRQWDLIKNGCWCSQCKIEETRSFKQLINNNNKKQIKKEYLP